MTVKLKCYEITKSSFDHDEVVYLGEKSFKYSEDAIMYMEDCEERCYVTHSEIPVFSVVKE